MNKNNWTYCCINLIKYEEDKGGYDNVRKLINSDSLLALCGNYDSQFICFKSYVVDENTGEVTNEVKLIPFIFKHDSDKKVFMDYFTSEIFSYHTYDNEPDKRKFFEDKGGFGEYIEEANPIKINVTNEDVKRILNSMTKLDKENYRRSLRELKKIVTCGYNEVYLKIRQEERTRKRNKL